MRLAAYYTRRAITLLRTHYKPQELDDLYGRYADLRRAIRGARAA